MRKIRFATHVLSASFLALIFAFSSARGAPGGFQVMETTVDQVHAAMKAGKLTSHQLVQLYLDRIAAYDQKGPALNSVITVNSKALEEADALDAAYKKSGFVGPLHGIPILVKDEVDTVGMPTTQGSILFKDYVPVKDAFVIEKLKKAGAIILGKTTLSEFTQGDAYGSMFGETHNPYDLDRTVGGSSGGSGAAAAANFCTLAVGEETGASIRRPSTWNSLVGLRPTPGLVSRTGMWASYPSPTEQMGPMTRTVRDLAILLDVMVGYDAEDPITALGYKKIPESYTKFLDKDGLKGARLGVIREPFGTNSEPDSEDFKKVDREFPKTIAELKAAGAVLVDPIVIPHLVELMAIRGNDPRVSDASVAHYLSRNPNSKFKTRDDILYSPDVGKIHRSKIAGWKGPRPAFDAVKYSAAVKAREELMLAIMKVMADNQLDAIVYKSVEHQPSLIKDGINPPYVTNKGVPTLNTYLIHSAAMTVPAGFTSDNLPVGITFFGPAFSEPTLIKLAYAYEQATHHRLPPKTTPALP
jgi:Asp-tRNA(Asn)/Glu-tRNA(Gln) amidotransferase A subunit family amidase